MMMFLKILTMFGVSKVLLLLGKLDPGWALFLKSPHLLYFALGGCTFPLKLNTLSICAKNKNKNKKVILRCSYAEIKVHSQSRNITLVATKMHMILRSYVPLTSMHDRRELV